MPAQQTNRPDEFLQNPIAQQIQNTSTNATAPPNPALFGSVPPPNGKIPEKSSSALPLNILNSQSLKNTSSNTTAGPTVVPNSPLQPTTPGPKYTLAPKRTPNKGNIPPKPSAHGGFRTKTPSPFPQSNVPSPGDSPRDASSSHSASKQSCNVLCQIKSYPSSVAILLILVVGLAWRRVMTRRRQHPGDRDRGQYRQLANMLSADDVFDDTLDEEDDYYDEYGLELSDVNDNGDLSLDEVNG